jgi:hypothetical protein
MIFAAMHMYTVVELHQVPPPPTREHPPLEGVEPKKVSPLPECTYNTKRFSQLSHPWESSAGVSPAEISRPREGILGEGPLSTVGRWLLYVLAARGYASLGFE